MKMSVEAPETKCSFLTILRSVLLCAKHSAVLVTLGKPTPARHHLVERPGMFTPDSSEGNPVLNHHQLMPAWAWDRNTEQLLTRKTKQDGMYYNKGLLGSWI